MKTKLTKLLEKIKASATVRSSGDRTVSLGMDSPLQVYQLARSLNFQNFMVASPTCKNSGKTALHSDLRARARIGGPVMAVNTRTKSHRSTSDVKKAGAAHAVEQRSRPTTRSTTVSLRQSPCLDVCGRESSFSAPAAARPRTGRGSKAISEARKKRVGIGIRKLGHRNAVSNANRVANGNARPVPHQVETKSHTFSAASVSKPGKPTGVRILQLNMQRSAVVTGEVRQLIAEKRLDVLLLQEP